MPLKDDCVGVICVRLLSGPLPRMETCVKLASDDDDVWGPPVLCSPVPDEKFYQALDAGDYDAIKKVVSTGYMISYGSVFYGQLRVF